MNNQGNQKVIKTESRKRVFGIKLPPIETNKESDIKTITDVDPEFYSLVEGRPVRPSTSISKYKQDIKGVALNRTLHGFLADEILRIDTEIETERNVYEKAFKNFEEYQNSFDKFLADDNNKTIAIMQKSDACAKDLANQMEEHKKANYEMASLKSKLQYIDETFLILLSIENFLHKAAPILWIESQNIKLDTKHSEIFIMDTDIFQKIDIPLIKERLCKLPPPRLYFETPQQLLYVFEMLEKQNLNYLLVTEELTTNKNKFLITLGRLKSMLNQELDYIQQKMKETEEIIMWNDIREVEIKEIFYRILEEKIRNLVSSEMVLQIYNYVEYAYEKVIAENDANLNVIDMTLALENEYDNLMMDLSAFDLDVIKEIEKETYANEDKVKIKAKEASKLLKEVDKLTKRLKSSCEPSRKPVFNEV